MNKVIEAAGRGVRWISAWSWRTFRSFPLVIQLCIVAASLGAILMGVFVGDIGLALMGTAIPISGIAVGLILGVLSVVAPWAARIIYLAKRNSR